MKEKQQANEADGVAVFLGRRVALWSLIVMMGLSGCAGWQSRDTAVPAAPSERGGGERQVGGNPLESLGSAEADVVYDVLLGEMALQRGKPRLAVKAYLEAARRSQDPEIAARATRVANFIRADAQALEAAEIWARLAPDAAAPKRVLTVLYLRNKQYEKAKQALRAYLEGAEPQALNQAFVQIGIMLQREADRQVALEIASALVDFYPDVPQANYLAAAAALRVGSFDRALAWADKALALKPDWADAVVLRAKALKGLGREDELRTYLAAYLENHPEEDEVRLAYARVLVDQRQLEEARDQFELLAAKMPGNKDVLFALAMLSMQFKAFDEAEGYLKQLTRLGRGSPQVHFYLGQIAEQKKDYATAIKWYSTIPQSDYYLEAQLRIAASLWPLKGLDEALRHLDGIATRDADERKEIDLFKGSLLRDAGQYQQAYEHYEKMLANYPNDPDFMYGKALVAERLNRVEEAISIFEYLTSQYPDNAAYLNALGYTLADRTRRYDEAERYVRKALELRPADPAIIDSMGWIYYRQGKLEEALKYLGKAMEMVNDGEVAAHYGEVLWKLGRREEATAVWARAREQFGDNEILQQTLRRFGQ